MPCYSPLKGYKSRANGGLTFRPSESNGEKMTVACGGCLGCRLDRSREWAGRIVHEAQEHDKNCFVTLTYNDEEMPRLFDGGPGTLVHKDFQKFMKRLRKALEPLRVRYFMCGEYGENTERPHYHACIFGFEPDDKKLFVPNEHGDLYTSDWLESVWKKGFCTVGELTFKSAAYVARYILKKRTGVLAEDHYLRVDPYGVACWLEPEYSSMSRRPGIGKKWFKKFKSDVFPSDDFPVPGVGVLPKPPRYYDKLLEAEDPEGLELVKQAREEFRKGNAEEYEPGRLMAKYKVKKRQLEFLRREL